MAHLELPVVAGILTLGILCQWLAWRLRIPAIIPLLTAGFAVGPGLGWLYPKELLGPLFFPVISLSVGVILFEGALTLEFREIRQVRQAVRSLITVGAGVTLVAGALASYWTVGLSWPLAVLFGALIVVTGPTVIGPLLRNIRPSAQVASILKWEGILIDPIGALLAVVIFDVIVAEGPAGSLSLHALVTVLRILAAGLAVGAGAGAFTAAALKRYWVPDYLREAFVLVVVLASFAVADVLQSESGLLAVTIMGIWLANVGLHQLHEVWHFKERLTVLLISGLFILLAANISREELALLDLRSLLLLGMVLFVIRPLSVFVSTVGAGLSRNERLFLAWVAPRGIVAASVSSLFAFRLQEIGYTEARLLAPLTFLVIVGTVLIHGMTAKGWAQRLGVAEVEPQGFLFLGAMPFARMLAAVLDREGFATLLVDTNRHHVHLARLEGLQAVHGNLLSSVVQDELDLAGIGRLLALTSNDEANALACIQFRQLFGSNEVYQLPPDPSEHEETAPLYAGGAMGRLLFAPHATYDQIEAWVQKGAKIAVTQLTEKFTYADYQAYWGERALPLIAIQDSKVMVATVEAPLQPRAGWKVVALIQEG
ncbi:MAG: sodium:proton antiporter [Candidatus Tectimicrobiota bacterium]|nr:MAG: sodium:proton antiporter [Candidatus Tectomicrobia bacterium]